MSPTRPLPYSDFEMDSMAGRNGRQSPEAPMHIPVMEQTETENAFTEPEQSVQPNEARAGEANEQETRVEEQQWEGEDVSAGAVGSEDGRNKFGEGEYVVSDTETESESPAPSSPASPILSPPPSPPPLPTATPVVTPPESNEAKKLQSPSPLRLPEAAMSNGKKALEQTDSETEYDTEDELEVLRAGAEALEEGEEGERGVHEVDQREESEKEKEGDE